jgi:IclR family transcriptional regulator, KDG regulon repressor
METSKGGEKLEKTNVRVLERAFDIIECFTEKDFELSLVQISERANLPLATTHRSIHTMMDRGYIDQNPKTGKYRLGMHFVRLSGLVIGRLDIIRIATPYLEDLSQRTGQNVNLSIYDQSKALCLVNIESFHNFLMGIKVGQRLPIYAGALSKVILAHLPDEVISQALSDDLAIFTPHTITHKESLLQELNNIKQKGYATSKSELATGAGAIAAPIFDYSSQSVAGISISGPEHHYTNPHSNEFLTEILLTAQLISKELGYAERSIYE